MVTQIDINDGRVFFLYFFLECVGCRCVRSTTHLLIQLVRVPMRLYTCMRFGQMCV